MSTPAKTVVHINFLPGELLFDARPVWAALNNAVTQGRIPALPNSLAANLGAIAIHLGTRDYVMRYALREMKAAALAMREFIPTASEVDSIPDTRVMRGGAVEEARDRALLSIDSFLSRVHVPEPVLTDFQWRAELIHQSRVRVP